jgi:hypothetical protein
MFTVKVLPAPDVTTGDVPDTVDAPRIFQFPAVGDKGPPELPVIVCPTAVPKRETCPDPFTVNSVELKEATPTDDVVALIPDTTTAPVVGDAVTPFVPITELTEPPPPPPLTVASPACDILFSSSVNRH